MFTIRYLAVYFYFLNMKKISELQIKGNIYLRKNDNILPVRMLFAKNKFTDPVEETIYMARNFKYKYFVTMLPNVPGPGFLV